MKRFLLHLDETLALGSKFVLHDLDETHLFIDKDILPTLEARIDQLMESLAPDLAEK
jgi:TFIIH basal transcription factor complex TTD-A subunit